MYVPLLVDDLERFLAAFKDYDDFAGFSVTIPHKVRVSVRVLKKRVSMRVCVCGGGAAAIGKVAAWGRV